MPPWASDDAPSPVSVSKESPDTQSPMPAKTAMPTILMIAVILLSPPMTWLPSRLTMKAAAINPTPSAGTSHESEPSPKIRIV